MQISDAITAISPTNPVQTLFSPNFGQNNGQNGYYYGLRFYNAEVGRWINRDPIGENIKIKRRPRRSFMIRYDLSSIEPNIFAFTLNAPFSSVDHLGWSTVQNNGTCPVIAKPEGGGYGNINNPPIIIPPGGSIDVPIDGVISCCPASADCPIMKVIDGGEVNVGNSGMNPVFPSVYQGNNGLIFVWLCLQGMGGGCRSVADPRFGGDTEWGTQDQIDADCAAASPPSLPTWPPGAAWPPFFP